MPTPHNAAQKGDFAKTVLMPGDPLRAKFIAETYLQNTRLVTEVRGMLGYTGEYHGVPVSVMGSGMGIPSIGIYSYELYTEYDVDNIIRIGSAGSYSEKAALYDVLLATAAYSESSYAKVQSGYEADTITPADALCERLRMSARKLDYPLLEGAVHSSDVFYRGGQPDYWKNLRDEHGCLAVEMESFGLFHTARVTGKNAACLVTISDSFVTSEATSAEARQKNLTQMIEIALGTLEVTP